MKRVAIFGNAGAGKSTLAKRLADPTGLPLHPLDLVQFTAGGGKIADAQFRELHARLILEEAWIIDGFGSIETAWERFAAADTLIFIDLPLRTHYWWETKRLLKAPLAHPEGWPERSPIWRSTLDSYRVVGRCESLLAPRYRALVREAQASKRVHHLKSGKDIRAFLATLRHGSTGVPRLGLGATSGAMNIRF